MIYVHPAVKDYSMEKGCYNVTANAEIPNDIVFSIKPDVTQVTENQQKLHLDIEKTLAVLRKVFADSPSELTNYFSQLLTLAQAGLTPANNAQPTISSNALQLLKLEIIDKKSGDVKNTYFRSLGLMALKLGVPVLCIGLLIKLLFYFFDSQMLTNLSVFANFLNFWAATLLGVWLSFGARKNSPII